MTERHPLTLGWEFPPPERAALPEPLQRVNLRELCARPGRLEHHLTVVGRIGNVQLEAPTASEPLSFAHVNCSDEYVIVLPTGHAMLDAFPYRTFVTHPDTHEDVLRINHRTLDLLLHPFGFSHWPGRLRAPYEMPPIPPGMRRATMTLILCASALTPPPEDRALWVNSKLPDAVKTMGEGAPALVSSLMQEAPRVVARVADVSWELVVDPDEVAPSLGAYVTLLDVAKDSQHFATDLVYVPPGARFAARGVRRALVMSSALTAVEPPPESWREIVRAPFAVFEQGAREGLPLRLGELEIAADDDARFVRVSLFGESRQVPRHWLARMLFRWALHSFRLGLLETYGGFFLDDRHETPRLGLSGVGHVTDDELVVRRFAERAYRACAPEGYVEHIG